MKKTIGYFRMKVERRARWDRIWKPLDKILRYIETIYWGYKKYTVVECFGDSHVKIFRRLNWMYPETSIRFRTTSVMGATAYGLSNTKSKTSARKIFNRRLEKIKSNHKIIVLLGEIDTGFLIWFLANKKNINVSEVLNETVKRYIDFLNFVRKDNDIIVCSAPLPTLDERLSNPDYLKERNTIKISKEERTALALNFNSLIREYCESNKLKFLNLDHVSLNPDTGLVRECLINTKNSDHHYEETAFAEMLTNELESISYDNKGYE